MNSPFLEDSLYVDMYPFMHILLTLHIQIRSGQPIQESVFHTLLPTEVKRHVFRQLARKGILHMGSEYGDIYYYMTPTMTKLSLDKG
ncbi:hypothetical protein [Radiobacillus deserti]|uniref:hypothetical protein n=1 Tax=Radiobacillus deserti TaxID=2594883 RepID=UPI001315242C|nr:hypothetical protein [Radiobacillus deserti]